MATAPTNNLTAGSGLLSQAAQATQTGPVVRPAPAPTAPATPTTTTASGGTSGPSLQSLYTQPPTAGTFASSLGTAATTGAAPLGTAANVGDLAGINSSGGFNPGDSTNAAAQIDAITNADSPYIKQAKQQGFLSAAGRGLANSSLSSGASEAAAVAAAAPLAEQNATTAAGGKMQNSQLDTQANEFNASQENADRQLNAQLQTQQEQFNKSQEQSAAATNTAAKNAMTQQTMQLNEQINQQYLSGSQAQTLAGIQGKFNTLIQQNASAASMWTSMQNDIGAVMANKDIAPQRVADTISAMQSLLAGGLSVVDAINGGTTAAVPFGTAKPMVAPRATNVAPAPVTAPGMKTPTVPGLYNNPLGLGTRT